MILFNRNILNSLRLPMTSYVKIGVAMILALVSCGSFHTIDGTNKGVNTRNGFMFWTIISQAFFTVQTFILVFPDERPVFLREINNNMYSHSSYFLSKVTAEMPLNIFLPMVFSVIVYWSVNLNVAHWYNWWYFYGTLVFTNFATTSYAICLGIACSEKAMAVGLTPVLLVPMGLFSGFLVNRD